MYRSEVQRRAFYSSELHELIGLIYDSVDSPEGFYPFLYRFIEVFQGHSAAFSVYDLQGRSIIGAWVVNIPREALEAYTENVGHRDALMETALAAAEKGDVRFVASNLDFTDEIPDIDEKKRVGDAWLASYGAHQACGAIAFKDDNYLNFFGIQRNRSQPEFTREQLAVFDQFLPHLNRAVGLYTKMSVLRAGYSPEALALQQIQRGILVCDATFRVIFKNATADNIIAANHGLDISPEGLLLFREREFSTRLTMGLTDAVRASVHRTDSVETVLRYRRGGQHLTVVISPLEAADEQQQTRGGAMVSLYDWSMRPTVSPDMLRMFFGLTETEARVSALLVEGRSVIEIADHLKRSRETVRTHLKSVYQKTNTCRQGELVALLTATSASA